MFTNTGTLSFYLNMIFLALAFVGLILVCVLILRSKVEQTKLDKLIEVGKWFFVSFAIVVATAVVSDGFKERDQDVKEIEVFNKHVATITKADGIEERWLLTEYFACVAPAGGLQTSWGRYKDLLWPQVEQYRKDKARKEELEQLKKQNQALTPEQEKEHAQLTDSTAKQEKPLISDRSEQTSSSTEWVIVAATDSTLLAAQTELDKAIKISPSAKIFKKGAFFHTVIPGFVSRAEAQGRLSQVKQTVRSDAYEILLSSWCTNYLDSGDFIQCN